MFTKLHDRRIAMSMSVSVSVPWNSSLNNRRRRLRKLSSGPTRLCVCGQTQTQAGTDPLGCVTWPCTRYVDRPTRDNTVRRWRPAARHDSAPTTDVEVPEDTVTHRRSGRPGTCTAGYSWTDHSWTNYTTATGGYSWVWIPRRPCMSCLERCTASRLELQRKQ